MTARVRRRRTLLPALLAFGLVPVLYAAAPAVPGSATAAVVEKSIFVSVVDANGRPVKDVKLGDILLREDGQDREVVAIKPASQPLSVAVLVDTAQGSRVRDAYGTPEEYVRDLRVSVGAFVQQMFLLHPQAAVSLMEFGQAAITMVPYTSDAPELEKGINRIVARPGVASVLAEALEAANKDLAKRPGGRRAIVSINLEPSDEQSFENGNAIKDAFRKSGAQLWSISVQRGGLKNSRRDLVLNDFSKLSGGRRDFVVGISAVPDILRAYANALAMQYEVVYKRPDANKTPQALQTGTLLQNVKVHASGFAPQ
jgi:hypothetical protein